MLDYFLNLNNNNNGQPPVQGGSSVVRDLPLVEEKRPCWPRSCRASRRRRGWCRSSNCTDLKCKKGVNETSCEWVLISGSKFALTVEADVARGADEEGLEEVVLGQLVDVGRDVDPAPADRHGAPEAQQAVQVEGRHLRVVPLVVAEVKVVRQRLLQSRFWENGINSSLPSISSDPIVIQQSITLSPCLNYGDSSRGKSASPFAVSHAINNVGPPLSAKAITTK